MFNDTTRYGLLKILADNPGLSLRNLAERLGISLGKVTLPEDVDRKGSSVCQQFSGNKLAYAYLLATRGVEQKAQMAVEFIKVKTQEYERLRVERVELEHEIERIPGGHQ